MARNLFWLFLLTWSSYGYTWWCSFDQTSDGWYEDNSMYCEGIDPLYALEFEYCGWFRPEDPVCSTVGTCVDQTEQRSISCIDPNTSGIINQARFYTCASDTWTDWQTTSESCIPNPPTCIESVEERTVECEPGYHGSSVEQKLTTCSTPYSEPVQSAWTMISTSCTLKAADPTSVESPLNPASPLSTSAVNSEPVLNTQTEPVTVEKDPVEMEAAIPTVEVEEKVESTQEPQSPKTKDNEEIAPGFGVVLMLNTLEQLNNIYEQPVDDFIGLYQDDYAEDQNILFNFIQSDDIGNRFDSIANHRWDQLHGDNPLQRHGFSD